LSDTATPSLRNSRAYIFSFLSLAPSQQRHARSRAVRIPVTAHKLEAQRRRRNNNGLQRQATGTCTSAAAASTANTRISNAACKSSMHAEQRRHCASNDSTGAAASALQGLFSQEQTQRQRLRASTHARFLDETSMRNEILSK
jgi:hypothetical protein